MENRNVRKSKKAIQKAFAELLSVAVLHFDDLIDYQDGVDEHLVNFAIVERVRPEDDDISAVNPAFVFRLLAANPLEFAAEHVWVGVHAVADRCIVLGMNRRVNQVEGGGESACHKFGATLPFADESDFLLCQDLIIDRNYGCFG